MNIENKTTGQAISPYMTDAAQAYAQPMAAGRQGDHHERAEQATNRGKATGSLIGATIGTILLPGIGTAIGAALGGAAGTLATQGFRDRAESTQRNLDMREQGFRSMYADAERSHSDQVAQANIQTFINNRGAGYIPSW